MINSRKSFITILFIKDIYPILRSYKRSYFILFFFSEKFETFYYYLGLMGRGLQLPGGCDGGGGGI